MRRAVANSRPRSRSGSQSIRSVKAELFLWAEVQTVRADQAGRYTVTLGAASSNGIPLATFESGVFVGWEWRWRVRNELCADTNFERALRTEGAADAETLGGKPGIRIHGSVFSNQAGEASATPQP